MACRISELVIDAAEPGTLAAFWSNVLGYVELGREDDGSIEIGPPRRRLRRPAASCAPGSSLSDHLRSAPAAFGSNSSDHHRI